MGRFYNTNHFTGKFGFAVQPSDDPGEVFGMEEQDRTEIDYFLDGSEENIRMVKKKLDEQYDILGVPQEKRVYHVESDEDATNKLYYPLATYAYEVVPLDEYKSKDMIAVGGDKEWEAQFYKDGLTEENSRIIAKPEKDLAIFRVYLGVKILSDLESEGECYLTAEL